MRITSAFGFLFLRSCLTHCFVLVCISRARNRTVLFPPGRLHTVQGEPTPRLVIRGKLNWIILGVTKHGEKEKISMKI